MMLVAFWSGPSPSAGGTWEGSCLRGVLRVERGGGGGRGRAGSPKTESRRARQRGGGTFVVAALRRWNAWQCACARWRLVGGAHKENSTACGVCWRRAQHGAIGVAKWQSNCALVDGVVGLRCRRRCTGSRGHEDWRTRVRNQETSGRWARAVRLARGARLARTHERTRTSCGRPVARVHGCACARPPACTRPRARRRGAGGGSHAWWPVATRAGSAA